MAIHAVATEHVDECPLFQARIFDYNYLRWETTYFLDRFVVGLRKRRWRTVRRRHGASSSRVARDGYARGIIHRDFQCQNIMIHAGAPWIIDYQGARMARLRPMTSPRSCGTLPPIDDRVRERLLAYYLAEMSVRRPSFDEKTFPESLVACRLQRHMQALGAYGFLAEVKGKTYFLKHVPEALALLREDLAEAPGEFPELVRLTAALWTREPRCTGRASHGRPQPLG